jgi:hypothetical protein
MPRMSRLLLFFGALLLMAATAGSAYCDTYDITWSGGYGPGGSLTVTAEAVSDALQVTALSGTQGSGAASFLAPGGYSGNDNYIDNTATVPTELVDGDGLGFSVGSTDFLLYDDGGTYMECSSAVNSYCNLSYGEVVTDLSVTPASAVVPEPSSLVLFSVGLLALGGTNWRKRLVF